MSMNIDFGTGGGCSSLKHENDDLYISSGSMINIRLKKIDVYISIYRNASKLFERFSKLINSNKIGQIHNIALKLITPLQWILIIQQNKEESYKQGWNDHIDKMYEKKY